jgi:hypothetical protein
MAEALAARTLAVRALGVPLALAVDDPALRETLSALLADVCDDGGRDGTDGSPGAPRVAITVRGHGPWAVHSPAYDARSSTVERALGDVCAAVNANAVSATPLLAFHAAVLAKQGRTLVVPGVSGLGKTTLTAGLLLRGWSYVSDEALALEWSPAAPLAYPRPLALSAWSRSSLGLDGLGVPADREWLLRPADLGAAVEHRPGPVTHLLLMEPREAAGGATPEPLPTHRSEAISALLQRGFTHVRDPARALTALAGVVSAAAVTRVRQGTPEQTAAYADAWALAPLAPPAATGGEPR